MNRHIDIDRLSRYYLNRLTPEEETAVQEHLRNCPECWTKVAAAAVIVAGIGLFTAETVRNRSNVLEQNEVIDGKQIENEVFAVDSFDREDSIYYREKYGDDFKF